MTANPDRIYADYNITYSIVSAEIKDGEGFGVPNQMVKFKMIQAGLFLMFLPIAAVY